MKFIDEIREMADKANVEKDLSGDNPELLYKAIKGAIKQFASKGNYVSMNIKTTGYSEDSMIKVRDMLIKDELREGFISKNLRNYYDLCIRSLELDEK